mmetsp:Transcript_12719/g.21575  ORF Transcript_12719/g.21575 Transcript_12719/m.21575 type:complete len:260 (+) Transcript_12719:150-929(+)|eukprot:CAMPEP_0198220238 /NCGR_PEP_ID=MMETSP1445-20131203/78230_1 /TAXON_ID=36898 /ORGANISM="Pyramimonas sp., Strain CCMP2087" /LENGTH=259 /DNA_ID=CAMNT_0043897955 /DNA_START=101 /DNA_END=880 /DNA_ORIENTATION=-
MGVARVAQLCHAPSGGGQKATVGRTRNHIHRGFADRLCVLGGTFAGMPFYPSVGRHRGLVALAKSSRPQHRNLTALKIVCTASRRYDQRRRYNDNTTQKVAECVQRFAHKPPIQGCPVEVASRDAGWESPSVLALLEGRIDSLSRILVCTREDVVSIMLGSPALVAVDDAHVVQVLMKLRALLPEADVSKLVQEKAELLLREDAMEKATEAVRVLTARELNPSQMVQAQPVILLYHHVWFSGDTDAGDIDDEGAMLHDA